MKELDFDELDKAVNSLMSQSGNTLPQSAQQSNTPLPSSAPPQPAKEEVPAAALSSIEIPNRPVSIPPEQRQVMSPPRTAPSSVPSLATKRSGRFMDVVHPSSDMTKASPVSTPNNEKVRLTPINSNAVPEAKPNSVAPVESPAITTASRSTLEAATSESEWPDPVEFHKQQFPEVSSTQSPADIPEPSPSPAVESTPEPVTTSPSAVSESAPSPFIVDAKVEKRPLGGIVTGDTAPVTEPNNDQLSASQDNSSAEQPFVKDDTQTTPKVELPAELHSDLLAVESDDAAKLPLTPAPASTQPSAIGPVSIAQQYKKQETSRDTSHTAMYDNAAQPLAHPAKKKSGWLGVVLILTVILLLVAAAAAAYFMGFIPL